MAHVANFVHGHPEEGGFLEILLLALVTALHTRF